MRSSPLGTLVLVALSAVFVQPAPCQSSAEAHPIPADFRAHRIYATPVTADGDTLRLYTDTGGGRLPILLKSTVDRLGLPRTDTLSRGGRRAPLTRFPTFRSSASIPPPQTNQIAVLPAGRQVRLLALEDGMLGQSWFAGRTWTFDYDAKHLELHPTPPKPPAPTHTVDLGFRTDSTGRRVSNHPRIEATIDGTTHSFLFDTGATTVLTDSVHATLGGPKRRGSSFIVASLFDRWRTAHPDWKVIRGASPYRRGTPLLRLPSVTVAGYTVGPVWVERRPAQAFHQMSASMDQPIQGVLGGSLLQYFRVTISYPEAWASFEHVQ
jgi:hypothetical protein